MAMGTLISRITGFLRTFVFVFALGTATLANAYNNANTLPNAVYNLMIGRRPDQRRGAAAGHRGQAEPGRRRSLQPADLHPHVAGPGRRHGGGDADRAGLLVSLYAARCTAPSTA